MSGVDLLGKLLDGVLVEWKDVGEVAQILNGFAFESSKYSSSGIRVIRISDVQKGKMSDKDKKFYPTSTVDEINKYLLREDDLVMSLTGNVGRVAMLSKTDLPAALNQRVACIRVNEQKTLTRYLFHFFDQVSFETEAMANATGGGQKNMSTKWLCSYKIPIPCPETPKKSIEIQAEIVRILDAFTELTDELTDELAARKKQYNYYRDQLLSFVDGEVEWKTLGALVDINTGSKPPEILVNATSYDYINAGTSRSGYSLASNCAGDAVTTPSRGQGGIGFVGYQSKPFWLGPLCYKLQSTDLTVLINKYLFYFLQSRSEMLLGLKKEGGVPAVNKSDLVKLEMPVPSLEKQNRIVAILDKFDALTNSLTEGLPREIELRQKQYEYYRDLLLSFPKPESAMA